MPVALEAIHVVTFVMTTIYFCGLYFKEYVVYEFAIILIYAIIYYTILSVLIIMGLIFLVIQCSKTLLETKKIIEEREEKNYSSDLEEI
jgi:hypothetical protein